MIKLLTTLFACIFILLPIFAQEREAIEARIEELESEIKRLRMMLEDEEAAIPQELPPGAEVTTDRKETIRELTPDHIYPVRFVGVTRTFSGDTGNICYLGRVCSTGYYRGPEPYEGYFIDLFAPWRKTLLWFEALHGGGQDALYTYLYNARRPIGVLYRTGWGRDGRSRALRALTSHFGYLHTMRGYSPDHLFTQEYRAHPDNIVR